MLTEAMRAMLSVLALARRPPSIPVSHHGGVDLDELFDAWDRAWSGRDPKGFEPICNPESTTRTRSPRPR